MLWFAEHFGLARMLSASVPLPEPRFLGEPYEATLEGGQRLMARICEHLAIAPAQFHLEVVAADCHGDAPRQTAPGVIEVDEGQLHDPFTLAATLAHHLVRAQLPLEDFAGRSPREVQWLADLAAVYLGLGVHVANGAVRQATQHEGHACSDGPRPIQHLPARMIGYALALFAYVRGETRPAWKSYLRLDALVAFSGGLTYLQRTGDTLFTAATARCERRQIPTDELLRQLAEGSRSARIAALWDLRDPRHASGAAQAVTQRLHDRLPAIREEAARTVAQYGIAGKQAIPFLIELLHDARSSIRAASAQAVGMLANDSVGVLEYLAPLLNDPDPKVVFTAAAAVRRFGKQGEEALPAVLAALRSAMIRCNHPLIDALTHTLFALDPDPTDRVMQFFEDDAELREQTVHIIVDALRQHDDQTIA